MEEVFLQPHPEAEGEKETSPKFSDNDSNFKCGGIDDPSLDNPSIHNVVDMEEDKVVAENGSELKMKNGHVMEKTATNGISNEVEDKEEVAVAQDSVTSHQQVTDTDVDVDILLGEGSSITATTQNEAECDDNPAAAKKKVIDEILIDDDTPMESQSSGNERRGLKRKRGELFAQENCCLNASKWLPKCRDCVARGKDKSVPSTFDVCRFQAFRKLVAKASKASKNCFFVEFAGFCDPDLDPVLSDKEIWMPNPSNPPTELPEAVCFQLLEHLGDQVCVMIRQEQEALEIEAAFPQKKKSKWWKRLVDGIREMCDVCATTLFNYHWICADCGFVACLDCFKARKEGDKRTVITRPTRENKDNFTWLHCCVDDEAIRKINSTNTEKTLQRRLDDAATRHELDKLELTQIIPGDCLEQFNKLLHQVRGAWNIAQNCGCSYAKEFTASSKTSALDNNTHAAQVANNDTKPAFGSSKCTTNNKMEESESDDDDEEGFSVAYASTSKNGKVEEDKSAALGLQEPTDPPISTLSPEVEEQPQQSPEDNNTHYIRSQWKAYYMKKNNIPKQVFYKKETEKAYPGLPHLWFCSGTLLRLEDPNNEKNPHIFQQVWKRGQPVLVSNVSDKLHPDLWSPESFLRDYGQERNDLINCLTGKELKDERISLFWKGFSDVKERIVDSNDEPMLLKLKDWPATEDFAKFSPKRFDDLMQALPLKEYTHRTGRLNLAARLPPSFMRPDLGPKMYIAYGHGFHLDKGTTVLHLDISDAVNVMVHVGIPLNADPNHEEAVMQAIQESDCDQKMIERVTVHKELPGALWHIYRPWDADKIRDLINRVSLAQGSGIEANNDPIHDQKVYLDAHLRKRLREEYNVVGFSIIQCAGDSVFIPAGAPHQVRNLHNCIKIAEDFVSPENVSHCFQLTEEFRNLSDTHSNHEDKLQIKNIAYHAVKDAMSVLMNARPLTLVSN